MRHHDQQHRAGVAAARLLLAGSLTLAALTACGGEEAEVADPTPSETPSASLPTDEAETPSDDPSPEPPPTTEPAPDPAADADLLCEDARSAIDDVPTTGSDDEDFAAEEYAVAEILRGLSAELDGVGAGELSDAVADYAQSRADLAVAYDQGSYDAVEAAFSEVELAAEEVAGAAAQAGASSCEQMARD